MEIYKLAFIRKKKRVILSANIKLSSSSEKTIYISVPEKYSSFLKFNYDPFIAAALLPSMEKGEDLHVSGLVSEDVVKAANKIMHKLLSWNLGLNKISFNALSVKNEAKNISDEETNNVLFFSGGVDSFYTYLKNKKLRKRKINYFIFVEGFDIKLKNQKLLNKTLRNIRKIAKAENIGLIEVRTNIREFLDKYIEWDYSHGAAMAFITYALKNGIRNIFISNSIELPFARKKPYGSHPDLDFLWSIKGLRFIHDGAEATRMQKIHKYISKSDLALKYLRVCWRCKDGKYNCGICEKCARTELCLYSAGVLDKCNTMPNNMNKKFLKQLQIPRRFLRYYKENLAFLRKYKPKDPLISDIKKCIKRNESQYNIKTNFYVIREAFGNYDSKYFNGNLYNFINKFGII